MLKLGRGSLKRRIAEIQSADVPIEVAQHAKLWNDQYTADEVQNVSEGIAAFFFWVSFSTWF